MPNPAYPAAKGPVVCVDEAHANFHTLDERFWAFGELLRRDGYVVRSGPATFDAPALAACRILVMFSAQVAGPAKRPMGMNAPGAEENFQFVLNVMHWLSGLL